MKNKRRNVFSAFWCWIVTMAVLTSVIMVASNETRVRADAEVNYMYVPLFSTDQLAKIDPVSGTISKISVGSAPQSSVMDANGFVYVSNSTGKTISVVDTASFSVVDTISVSAQGGSFGLTLDPTMENLYICTKSDGIWAYNLSAKTMTKKLAKYTYNCTVTEDYIYCPWTSDHHFYEYNLSSGEVTDIVLNNNQGSYSIGNLSPDGKTYVITSATTAAVAVVDIDTGTVQYIALKSYYADFSADGQYIYICDESSTFYIYDASTLQKVSQVNISNSQNFSFAVDETTHTAYVLSYNDSKMAVIDISNVNSPSKVKDIYLVGKPYISGGFMPSAYLTKKMEEAQGPAAHTVSFNYNGHGTGCADFTLPVEDSSNVTATATAADPEDGGWSAAQKAALENWSTLVVAPVDADYTFGGWYTDSGCTSAASFSAAITDDVTFYAKWTEKSSGGGGGEEPEPAVHVHSWTYEIENDEEFTTVTVTGYCNETSVSELCTYQGKEHGVAFTMSAPATRVISAGTPSAIMVNSTDLTAFNTATGLNVQVGDVVYYTASGDLTNTDAELGGAASEGAAPETAGIYCAAVDIGDEKAYVWFKIAADSDDMDVPIEIPAKLPWEKSEGFETEIVYSDGFLHMTNTEDPIRMFGYAYDMKTKTVGDKVAGTYLDLTDETLTTSLAYDCYSLDGGATWKAVKQALTGKDIGKWFSADRTILIANKYDKTGKKPADDATVYYLGKTTKRADAIALKPEYAICRDPYNVTNGQWSLKTSKGEVVALSRFEFKPLDDLAATLCANVSSGTDNIKSKALANLAAAQAFTDKGFWATWPGKGGIWVLGTTADNKAQKAKYEYRVKATVKENSKGELIYTPASKVKKFTVSSVQKPTKIKADYKKETLNVKGGSSVFFGTAIPTNASGVPKAKELPSKENLKTYEDYEGKIIVNMSKERAKGFSIAPYITETRNTILVWTHATEKKPASKVQTIILAARAQVEEKSIAPDAKGKITVEGNYEVLNAKGKWVAAKNLTATEDTIFKIRVKCTAKGSKETGTTIADYSASAIGIEGSLKLTVSEGKVTGATLSRQTKEELEPKSE